MYIKIYLSFDLYPRYYDKEFWGCVLEEDLIPAVRWLQSCGYNVSYFPARANMEDVISLGSGRHE